jgi:hypothetical protein
MGWGRPFGTSFSSTCRPITNTHRRSAKDPKPGQKPAPDQWHRNRSKRCLSSAGSAGDQPDPHHQQPASAHESPGSEPAELQLRAQPSCKERAQASERARQMSEQKSRDPGSQPSQPTRPRLASVPSEAPSDARTLTNELSERLIRHRRKRARRNRHLLILVCRGSIIRRHDRLHLRAGRFGLTRTRSD